jgi:ribonuclease III
MSNSHPVDQVIGYTFTDKSLRDDALVADYAPVSDGSKEGNKRLALIGDALLQLVILDEWYPSGKSIGISLLSSIYLTN